MAWLLWLACVGADTAETDDPSSDLDGDTISDRDEGDGDTDNDGTPDFLDTDSDGDGLPDRVEAGDERTDTPPVDTDGDGTPDFQDTDSDGDGISDRDESPGGEAIDSDSDGTPNFRDTDSDGNGIPDADEGGGNSDGDGIPDVRDLDDDDDGMPDREELVGGARVDTDGDGLTDDRDTDSDGDGVADRVERGVDTDGDGVADFRDLDSDADGLADGLDEARTDPDGDGDGVNDGIEVALGSDPANAGDTPVIDLSSVGPHDIAVPLTIQKLDVALLVQPTNAALSAASEGRFRAILDASAVLGPDVAGAVAGTGDYHAYHDFGSSGIDSPFFVITPMTTSRGAIDALSLPVNDDRAEVQAGMEGLYQLATGAGYDGACDGDFDPGPDVPPFSGVGPFTSRVRTVVDEFATIGSRGGLGFRDQAMPLVVFVATATMRDADDASFGPTPGGCPADAGFEAVVSAMDALGARLVIVDGSERALPQLEALAEATGSTADLDADGVPEPLVARLSADRPTLASDLEAFVIDAIGATLVDLPLGAVTITGVDLSGAAAGVTIVPEASTGDVFGWTPMIALPDPLAVEQQRWFHVTAVSDRGWLVTDLSVLVIVPAR